MKKYLLTLLTVLTILGTGTKSQAKESEILFEQDLINYVIEIAEEYELDPNLIFSMIESESTFNPEAQNGVHEGLMQVNPGWHEERMKELNCDNLYNPYENILIGTDYIRELIDRFDGNIELALMSYNQGPDSAKKDYKDGYVSYYATNILNRTYKFKKIEDVEFKEKELDEYKIGVAAIIN